MFNQKCKRMMCYAAGILTVGIIWLLWANTALVLTHIEYKDEAIPETFEGFRIIHLSDIHDAQIGRDNHRLVKAVTESMPDIIVITGDLVDSNRTDIERALSLCERLPGIAPTFYVNGNHEAVLADKGYSSLADGLRNAGITVLEDEMRIVSSGDDSIRLIGMRDIGFINESGAANKTASMAKTLAEMIGTDEGVNIVLSHRPELIDAYSSAGADLVLCGHAHGGQARIPFVGGLIAPGQGLFPEYDAGLYRVGDTDMIVSRGIGNSVVPLRVNNRPEIIVIDLKKQ